MLHVPVDRVPAAHEPLIVRATRIATLCMLVIATSCASSPDSTGDDERADRAADRKLETYVERTMRATGVPGMAIAIVKDGAVVLERGYGVADVEQQRPVTPDTLFLIASVSKTVTGVALMKLWEQGKVDLDDPINDHLPFAVVNPFFPDRPITVRMLLTHSSSIRDNTDVLLKVSVEGQTDVTLAEFIRDYFAPGGRYYAANLNFSASDAPGDAWSYSNTATALLGYLVQQVSGRSFEHVTRDEIFLPLGMTESSWHLVDLDPDHLAVPYEATRDGGFRALAQTTCPDFPDGNLRTSAHQLARFLLMFMNGGSLDGTRVLKRATVNAMRRDDEFDDQGLMWDYTERGDRRLLGHRGVWLGWSASMFFEPETGIGAMFLANGNTFVTGTDEQQQELSAVLDRLFEEADRW